MPQLFVEIVSQAFAVARGGGQKNVFNIYHFRRAVSGSTVSKANIEASFQTSIMTPVLAFLNVDYTQSANTVRFYDDALDAPQSFAETSVGGGSGTREETFVSATLRLKSATRGKFARGSKHYSPIGENQSAGDTLVSGSVTLLTAIGTALIAGFVDSDMNTWVPVIKSNQAPAQYKVNPVIEVHFDVISFVVNKSLGTMKRRKVKTVI